VQPNDQNKYSSGFEDFWDIYHQKTEKHQRAAIREGGFSSTLCISNGKESAKI